MTWRFRIGQFEEPVTLCDGFCIGGAGVPMGLELHFRVLRNPGVGHPLSRYGESNACSINWISLTIVPQM